GRIDVERRWNVRVLELRFVRGPVRARRGDQVGVFRGRHELGPEERHVDGLTARGRRRRALSVGEPAGDTGSGGRRDRGRRDGERPDKCPERYGEPPPLLEHRRGRDATTAGYDADSATTA